MSPPISPKPLSVDTDPEVEAVWIAMQRERGSLWRLNRAIELTTLCWRAGLQAVRQAHPGLSRQEQDFIFLKERYGEELAGGAIAARVAQGFYDEP